MISGCVIAKNEEKDIEKCIRSLMDICDEVVVVDTGSTDNTVIISKELGAKVYSFTWDNDFSAARNFTIDKTNGEWILFLDADEYLVNTNKNTYSEIIKIAKKYDGVLLNITNISIDNEVQSSFKNVRLFRKENIRYKNRIHENPTRIDEKPMHVLDVSNEVTIMHTGYTKEKTLSKNRFERNLKLLFEELKEKPNDPLIYWYIAETYQLNGELNKQIEFAKKSIVTGALPTESHSILPYITLINAYLDLYSKDCSINSGIIRYEINKAIIKFPNEAIFRMFLGTLDMKENRFQASLKNMEETTKLLEKGTVAEINYTSQFLHVVYSNKGLVHQFRQEWDKAIAEYTKSLQLKPYQTDVLKNTLLILENEKAEEIIEYLCNFYDINKKEDLDFLIQSSLETYNTILLSYYLKKLSQLTSEGNIAIIWSLLFNGNYTLAFEKSYELFCKTNRKDILVVTILSSILIEDRAYVETIVLHLDESYKKVIESMFDKNIVLNEKDKDSLMHLIDELLKIKKIEKVEFFLERHKDFIEKYYFDVGMLFYNNRYCKNAIVLFNRLLEQVSLFQQGIIYKMIGLSYYFVNNYEYACENLLMAVDMGILENQIYEYLMFIREKVDERLRNRIDFVINIVKNQLNLSSENNNYQNNMLEYMNLQFDNNNEILELNYDNNKQTDEFIKTTKKLNLGCGRNILNGWINLDLIPATGVDVIADLDDCKKTKLPFEDNSVDEFLASHVIEHIKNPLPLMQELHRIAKPGAKAIFKCPYGSSDDAFEDPTHVRQYFINSFVYFSQSTYWRADYGYRGDWVVEKIILSVDKTVGINKSPNEILVEINKQRNIVKEMIAELIAVKPIRQPNKNLCNAPNIEIRLV